MGGPRCHLSILRNGNVPSHYFVDFPVNFKIIQCRLSLLRNGNVPCCYFLNFPVNFKIVQCRLSILRNGNVPCRYFSNVPVDFKVVQCRLSNLRKRCVALSILRVKGPSNSKDTWLGSRHSPTLIARAPLHGTLHNKGC